MNEQDWRKVLSNVDKENIEQTILWCQDIVNCLVRYGGKTQREAEQLVVTSFVPGRLSGDVSLIFHEIPYYWAMFLLHQDGNEQWYKDRKLWPPPDDYRIPWPSK